MENSEKESEVELVFNENTKTASVILSPVEEFEVKAENIKSQVS